MKKINVMIVEDQILHKELFSLYIKNSDRYNLVYTTDNAALADMFLINNEIDFILMDVYTAMGESGLDASEKIKKKYPHIKIMIITSIADHTFIKRAKEIGVESFWYKEAGATELIEIMDLTVAGESIYPNDTLNVKLGQTNNKDLNETELEIIRLIVSGKTNEEIAEIMKYKYNTIRNYIKVIFEKTGYTNRTELAVMAIKNRLVFDNFKENSKENHKDEK